MKKWFCVLLSLLMISGMVPALASETETEVPQYDYSQLTVGNPTSLSGQFFSDLWASGTSDCDVRHLLTGYNLITLDGEMDVFRFDRTVVSGAVIGDDKSGNRRYLINLYDDLYYSDGTPITAWDYAFSILLQIHPIIRELGGTPLKADYLLGYEEYVQNPDAGLAGLRVTNDSQMMITVKGESLPFFYELARLSFDPYPISVIAPGCDVRDNGKGARIISKKGGNAASVLTAELLRETILDPEKGYRSHPVPCSGPYMLESYDGSTAVMTVNPWFKGTETSGKPHIPKLVYTVADNENMIKEISEGKWQLLNKVTRASTVQAGMELAGTQPWIRFAGYPRVGLTYLYFMPESPKVQETDVRAAIAGGMDRESLTREYTGGFGMTADGFYGLGQWMYQLAAGTLLPPEAPEGAESGEGSQADWSTVNLNGLTRYPFDPEAAAQRLDSAGWNLNANGEAYDASRDAYRCKRIGDGLVSLDLCVGCPDDPDVEAKLNEFLVKPLAGIGIQADLKIIGVHELDRAIREGSFDYDLIYMGNNFSACFNPALYFTAGKDVEDGASPESLPAVHAEITALSADMDRTERTDVLGYMQKWVRLQERFTETLPAIPVYDNIYFDFYPENLQNYYPATEASWGRAIVSAIFGDVEEDEDDFEFTDESGEPDESDETEADVEIDVTEDTGIGLEAFLSVEKKATAASGTRGALSPFPKSVQRAVPEGYDTINEFVTASMGSEHKNLKSMTVEFTFETQYPEGETVFLLFGLTDEGKTSWIVREAVCGEEGGVYVTLGEEQLDQLAGRSFALVVVSKE